MILSYGKLGYKASYYLVAYIILFFFVFPGESYSNSTLYVQVEGSNPSRTLANLYEILINKFPSNFVSDEEYCSGFPWNQFVDTNIWPRNAYKINLFENIVALTKNKQKKCYFGIKNIKVEELKQIRSEVLLDSGENSLTEEGKKSICNKGKKFGDKDGDCILSAVEFSSSEAKEINKKSKNKINSFRVNFYDVVYKASINIQSGDESESSLKDKFISEISNYFNKPDDRERVLIFTSQQENYNKIYQADLRQNNQTSVNFNENDTCLTIKSLATHKKNIDQIVGWPNLRGTDYARNASLLVLDPQFGNFLQFNESEKKLINIGNIENDSYMSRRSKELLANPFFLQTDETTHPIAVSCGNIEFQDDGYAQDKDLEMLSHLLAVSSASISKLVSVRNDQANQPQNSVEPVRLSGFILPSSLNVGSDRDIYTPISESRDKRYVIMAPFQGYSPIYDNPQNTLKSPLDEPIEKIKPLLNSRVSVIIISAPKIQNQENSEYPNSLNYSEEWQNFLKSCLDWPACLGVTPYAITVAPLDLDGNLLRTDPISNERYKLGGSVVTLAAPAMNIPALANVTSGKFMYSGYTGTSVGIASVGALALKLTSLGVTDVRSRILATANLDENFDSQIGFGTINAARAFFGLINTNGAQNKDEWEDMLWKIINQNQRKDFDASNVLQGTKVHLRGLDYNDVCDQSLPHPKGYIPYFTPDEIITDGLKRDNQKTLKCIPVHRLLRLRQEGNSISGGLPFTIVYYKDNVAGRIAPTILRNVVLNNPGWFNVCKPTGFESSISFNDAKDLGKNRPCLWNDVDENNYPEGNGIDLKGVDIIFNPQNIIYEKNLFTYQY